MGRAQRSPRAARKTAARPSVNGEVLCFGETLGLILNPRGSRLRDCVQAQMSFAGAESNVAIGLARLGCRVSWLSAVGADPVGDRVLRQLRAEGVGVSRVLVDAVRPTAMMLRDRVTWTEPSVYYWRDTSAFSQAVGDLVKTCDWNGVGALHLSGITPALNEKAHAATRDIIAAARKRRIPVWFDINHRRKLWTEPEAVRRLQPLLGHFDILFLSEDEGRMLTGKGKPEDIGRALLDQGVRRVVLKLGVRGVFAFEARGKVFCPPFKIEAEVDPIGAGDGFDAGFLSGVIAGRPIEESLLRGSACGAMVCLTDGDWEGLPTPAELERFLAQERRADR
jgi:2-dehydro-3-deoxygluconokinase